MGRMPHPDRLLISADDAIAADPATWPIDDDLVDRVRLLRDPAAREAAELAEVLLERGALSRDLFEIAWEGALFDETTEDEESGDEEDGDELPPLEGVEVYRDAGDAGVLRAAGSAIEGVLTGSAGPVLVVWSSGVVGLSDVETVRAHWTGLIAAGFVEDVTILPADGAWALRALHGGKLEIGRSRAGSPRAFRIA